MSIHEYLRDRDFVPVAEYAAEVGAHSTTINRWCIESKSGTKDTIMVGRERWVRRGAFQKRIQDLEFNREVIAQRLAGSALGAHQPQPVGTPLDNKASPKDARFELRVDERTLQLWRGEAHKAGMTVTELVLRAMSHYISMPGLLGELRDAADRLAAVLGETKP